MPRLNKHVSIQKDQFHSPLLQRAVSNPRTKSVQGFSQQQQRVRNYSYLQSQILGKGYSSIVYKAHKANKQHQTFALKVINLSLLTAKQRGVIEEEAEIHKNLNHLNIVKCYQSFKYLNLLYIVLEYCPSGTLHQYLKDHTELQESSTINIMSQVVQGYSYLISNKILHRDLKPQNVLKKGTVWKISDFGFSTRISTPFIQDQMNVGTAVYMPPQSLQSNRYSHKSDFFSLGVMIYKLLTGERLHGKLCQKMRSQDIQFPEVHSPVLNQLLQQCLKIDFSERIQAQKFMELGLKLKQFSEFKTFKQLNLTVNKKKFSPSKPQTKDNNSDIKLSTIIFRKYQKCQSDDKNMKILQRNIIFCDLLYSMVLNMNSIIMKQQLDTKQILTSILYKYILKTIRMLNDTKINHFYLQNWQQLIQSQIYINMQKQTIKKRQFYEKDFFNYFKSVKITTIRFINKKLPELGLNINFGEQFYINLISYIKPFVDQISCKIEKKDINCVDIQNMTGMRLWIQFVANVKDQMSDFEVNLQNNNDIDSLSLTKSSR